MNINSLNLKLFLKRLLFLHKVILLIKADPSLFRTHKGTREIKAGSDKERVFRSNLVDFF